MRRSIHRGLCALAIAGIAAGCSPSPSPERPTPVSTVETTGGTASPPTTGGASPAETAPTPSTTPTTPPAGTVVVGKDPCKSDDDCVSATCCQGQACVAERSAPDCSRVRCALDCSKPTLECGGGCFCQGGFCAARLGTTPP